jgi:hypothetical protein
MAIKLTLLSRTNRNMNDDSTIKHILDIALDMAEVTSTRSRFLN